MATVIYELKTSTVINCWKKLTIPTVNQMKVNNDTLMNVTEYLTDSDKEDELIINNFTFTSNRIAILS